MSNNSGLSKGLMLGFAGVAVMALVSVLAIYYGLNTRLGTPETDPVAVVQPDTDVSDDAAPEPDPAEAEDVPSEPSETAAAQPEETGDASDDSADDTAAEASAEDIVDETDSADAAADLPDPPTIDTFRLEPDGRMLIAGRTAPDWETSILLDGAALGTVTPDANGQFVEFRDIPGSDKPRVLSLSMRLAGGGDSIASVEEIIIAPSPAVIAEAETDDPAAQPDATGGDTDPAAETEDGAGEDTTAASSDTTGETALADAGQSSGQSPAVLLADESGVRVLQPPEPLQDGPETGSAVALDAISYSEDGQVQISGRAGGEGHVRIYLDNAPVTTSPIQQDGNWRTDLPEVDTGAYTLRIDEVDAEGNVTSRVEAPFKREGDIVLTEVQTAGNKTQVTAVTVVPGSTLWAISRAAYGEGILYVRVFEANRDLIRNPDLIYPGQVFTVPQ